MYIQFMLVFKNKEADIKVEISKFEMFAEFQKLAVSFIGKQSNTNEVCKSFKNVNKRTKILFDIPTSVCRQIKPRKLSKQM